jgi:hypothetical protein
MTVPSYNQTNDKLGKRQANQLENARLLREVRRLTAENELLPGLRAEIELLYREIARLRRLKKTS